MRIDLEDLPERLAALAEQLREADRAQHNFSPFAGWLAGLTAEELECHHVAAHLIAARGNISLAARRIRVSRGTVYKRLARMQVIARGGLPDLESIREMSRMIRSRGMSFVDPAPFGDRVDPFSGSS